MAPSPLATRLDDAIKAYAEDIVDDGEVIIDWIVCAATRRYDGGGVVITLSGQDGMPEWQARGILTTALRMVDQQTDTDQ